MTNYVLGTIDAGGDGKAVLLANVNAVHGTNFTLEQFSFGDPQAISIPNPTKNTRIGMMPKAATGYYGTKWIYYNRIHVTELGDVSVARGSATRVVDLLEQINQKLGILIVAADIYDAPLPPAVPGEDTVSIPLDFRDTSVIYYGGTFIQLGNNDPTVPGTTPSLPFVHDLILHTNAVSRYSSGMNGGSEQVSLSFDSDKSRKRSATLLVKDGDEFTMVDLLRAGRPDQKAVQAIFSWKNTAGVNRAILNNGEVITLDIVTNLWSVVTQLDDSYNLNSYATHEQVMDEFPVVVAAQADDGKLVAVQGTILYVSTDNGDTWSALALTDKTGTKLFDSSYTSNFRGHDAVIRSNTFYALVSSTSRYPTDPSSHTRSLGVEVVNLATGATSYRSLQSIAYKNGQLAFMDEGLQSAWTFLTPHGVGAGYPRVVGHPKIGGVNQTVFFDVNSSGDYELSAIRETERLRGDDSGVMLNYIQAYEVPLVKNTHVVEVVEIGTYVRATEPNPAFLFLTHLKGEADYLDYGVRVFTRLRSTSGEHTAWTQTDVVSPGMHGIQAITAVHQGKRTHYHMQQGYGVIKLEYTEDTAGRFIPSWGAPYLMDRTQGGDACVHTAGAYHATPVAESVFSGYTFTAEPNTEVTKALIDYSFVATDVDGSNRWLVAAPGGNSLSARVVDSVYGEMDPRPVATFAQNGALYYWSAKTYAIHKSVNGGRAWARYASSMYHAVLGLENNYSNHGGEIANSLHISPAAFKGGYFSAAINLLDLRVTGSFELLDYKDENGSLDFAYDNQFLLEVNEGQGAIFLDTDEHRKEGGVNVTSQDTPTRIYAWDVSGSDALTYGRSTNDVDTPLSYVLDNLSFADPAIPADFIPLGVWDALEYVELNRITVGYVPGGGNPVYSIYETDYTDTVSQVQLFGGSGPYSAFRPEVGFFLWDYKEGDEYVPFVLYGGKRVMVLNRFDEAGAHSWTNVAVTVPGDNGAPITAIPMLNENRREYLFAQKGNGIFRITYAYVTLTKVTTIALQKLFDLTATANSALDIVSGTCLSKPAVTMPTTAITPTYPPDGTLISWACQGFDKIGTYADGSGGTTTALIEANSADCGYVAPPPTGVGADSAEIVINTDNSGTNAVETDTLADEGGNAYVVWELAEALNAAAEFTIGLNYDTAGAPDIAAVHYKIGYAGSWQAMAFPHNVTLPAGETVLCLRVAHAADETTEGTETYYVTLTKVSSNITNTAPIVTEITINDTSVAPPPGASSGPVVMMTLPAAPFIQAYRWSDADGFGTGSYRYTDPTTALTQRTGGVAFSPDQTYVFTTTLSADPSVHAYAWDYATGFGTRYDFSVGSTHNPTAGGVESITTHPDGTVVFITLNQNTRPLAVRWQAGVGFGTLYDEPAGAINGLPTCHHVCSADGQVVFMAGETAGTFISRVQAWPWNSSTGYGAPYANLEPELQVMQLLPTPSGAAVIMALGGDAMIGAYRWNNTTGFGTAYAVPADVITVGQPWINAGLAMNPAGTAVAICANGNPAKLAIYEWDDVDGFGARYDTVDITTSGQGVQSITWTPDGGAIILAHDNGRGYTAYHWSDVTGVGAVYAPSDEASPATVSAFAGVRELIVK